MLGFWQKKGAKVLAALIVLVIRTRKPFFISLPGRYLIWATMLVLAVTIFIPFSPFAALFGFTRLPVSFLLVIGIIILMYIFSAELAKRIFDKYNKM